MSSNPHSRKRWLIVAAAAVVSAGVAAPAQAHVTISKTSPARGTTLKRSPSAATITFSGPIRRGTIKVYRVSNGKQVSRGSGGRDPRNIKRVLTSFKSRLKSGTYRVVWTCVASDGHHQSGRYTFKVKL